MADNNLEIKAEAVESSLTSLRLEVAMLLGFFNRGEVTNNISQIHNRLHCLKEQVLETEVLASNLTTRLRIHNIKNH